MYINKRSVKKHVLESILINLEPVSVCIYIYTLTGSRLIKIDSRTSQCIYIYILFIYIYVYIDIFFLFIVVKGLKPS